MQLAIDTHVHIYSFFDEKIALDSLRLNLTIHNKDAICIGFLVEPMGGRFLKDFRISHENAVVPGFEIHWIGDLVRITETGFPVLYLFPGQQIVTKERIEILCLLKDLHIHNGLPAQEVINRILNDHGVPVISWSPGKWLFKRRKVVRELLRKNKPGSVLIGDTSLRPRCWPRPSLMKKAVKQGFTLIAGSDPLPLRNQEKLLGQYGISIDIDFNPEKPVESLLHFFSRPGANPVIIGKRAALVEVVLRLYRHWRGRKSRNKISEDE